MISSLLRAGVHASLLALVVLLVGRFLKGSHPSTRAWLWWLVSAELAFGWLFVIPLPASLPRPEHVRQVTAETMYAIAETPDGVPVVKHLESPSVLWILGGVWLIGVAYKLGQSLTSTLKLWYVARSSPEAFDDSQRLARRMSAQAGLATPPRVCTTTELDSPAIFGLLHPTLFLPTEFTSLSAEEQEMAFIHELTHIRRRDGLLAIVPELASAVFWFFPLSHWAKREWVVQRELACDAEVLQQTGCTPSAYGRFLLRVVEGQKRIIPAPALGVTADFMSLKRRLSALSGTLRRPRPGLLSVLLVGALALPVASQSPSPDGGLLKNAGFEDGSGQSPDGWNQGATLDGVAYIWETGVSHSGKHSLSIKKDAKRYFPIAQWYQTVPYDGKSAGVKVMAYVKASQVTKAIMDVQFIGDDGATIGHHWVAYVGSKNGPNDPPVDCDWKQVGGVAKVPAGTKAITVALQDYGPGQIWIDDVSATYSDEPETDALKD